MSDAEKRSLLQRRFATLRDGYPTLHVPDYDTTENMSTMLVRLERERKIDDMATGPIYDMYLICQRYPILFFYVQSLLGDNFDLFLDPTSHHVLAEKVLFPLNIVDRLL